MLTPDQLLEIAGRQSARDVTQLVAEIGQLQGVLRRLHTAAYDAMDDLLLWSTVHDIRCTCPTCARVVPALRSALERAAAVLPPKGDRS